ncbi:hypothetical protein VPH35_112748 [Triticum aestivum]
MVELLFGPAEAGLVHLPEVLDCLATRDADHRDHAHHHAAHSGGRGALMDIVETPGNYAFLLDVPGISKYDIKLRAAPRHGLPRFFLDRSQFNITNELKFGHSANGKRKWEEEEGDCHYIRLERRASLRSVVRKFRSPKDVEAGAVAARYENGMLTVTVKNPPPSKKKTKFI